MLLKKINHGFFCLLQNPSGTHPAPTPCRPPRLSRALSTRTPRAQRGLTWVLRRRRTRLSPSRPRTSGPHTRSRASRCRRCHRPGPRTTPRCPAHPYWPSKVSRETAQNRNKRGLRWKGPWRASRLGLQRKYVRGQTKFCSMPFVLCTWRK